MQDDSGDAGPAPNPPPAVPARSAPSRRSRWLGSLLALLALSAIGGLAYYLTHRPPAADAATGAGGPPGGGPGSPGGPGGFGGGRGGPPTTVAVATAEAADIPIVLEALGTVTPSATVTVRPQVSGPLSQVLFREGQTVARGQLLARIDPRPFEIALKQAQGQRLRDEAQLDNARLTLQRFSTLLQQDSIARQDVDTQAATVKQFEGTVLADRAAESAARLNLDYTRITAPIAGRLGLRVVDVGNLVASSDIAGVAVITRLAPIDVEFAVPQDRVPDIERQTGAGRILHATVLDRNRSTVLDIGTFSTLNNQIDTQTGTVRAKARFDNAKATLFPSQFVNVRLQIDTVRGAVVVPTTALRHAGDGDFVYVLGNDRTVTQRKVVRGEATVDKVAISQGLQAGERVITEGGDRLKDGARVQLPGDRPRAGTGAASGAASGAAAPGASAGVPPDGASRPRRSRPASAATAASGS